MYEGFGLDSLRHIRLLPWMRALAQAYGDTIPPASPLSHQSDAPFKPSGISTERLRRYIRRHDGFQTLQHGSVVWYSSGQQNTSVTLFTVIQTPLPPSDGRSYQGKAKPISVFPKTSLLAEDCITP